MHGDSLGYQNAHRGDADSEKCFGPLLYAGVHGGPGKMAQHADGVIVGSAIVRQIGELGEEAEKAVSGYVSEMKAAITI